MADNYGTDASGVVASKTFAGDEIGGIVHPRVKLEWGADGVAGDVHAGNPLPTTVSTVPAAARTTDSVSAADATDKVMVGTTELTPKFAKIVASASGASQVVAAVGGKKIRVLRWSLVCNGAVNVKWQSHVTPTDLTGLHYFSANGGISEPYCKVGHFETVSGEALDINLSGAIAVGGSLTYVEV